MKNRLAWALLVYLVLVVGHAAYGLGMTSSTAVTNFKRKFDPATFAFWQDGAFWSNPPLFTGMMDDARGLLAPDLPEYIEDVDIVVLLLDGLEDIRNVPFASELDLDVEDIAANSAVSLYR
jgi:hypothetical protein